MTDDLRTVTEIRSHARGSKRRTVSLDGETWRSLSADLLRELGIRVGDTLDPVEVESRAFEVESRLARERSLRLIAYKDRSEAGLTKRLLDDGYPQPVVGQTIAWLLDVGLIDDRRFAEALARSLVEVRGLGRKRALRDMLNKGVPDELALEAVDSLCPESDEPGRALEAANRLCRAGDTPDRLAARLLRRGFSTANALRAAHTTLPDDFTE